LKIMTLARKTIVILIIFPIIGGALGPFLSNLGGSSTPWESLGVPSSPAESFISISPFLLVESTDENIFTYSGSKYGWKPYEGEIQSSALVNEWILCEGVQPPPIEEVIDSIEECTEWGLGYSYSKYVILFDGTVWKWSSQDSSEWDVMFHIFSILGGAILFLVVALIILAFLHFNALLKRLEERARSR